MAGVCELPEMMDVPVVTDRRRGAIGVDLNADHLAVAETDASAATGINVLGGCRWSPTARTRHQAEALIGDAVAGVVRYAQEAGKPIVIEKLDFRQKKAAPGRASLAATAGCCRQFAATARSRRTSSPAAIVRELKSIRSTRRSVPSIGRVKFMERYGLTCTPGSGLGAGPTLSWLLRAHPPPVGGPHWQWRTYRLHRTREEASEARVDVLGCCFETAETGACSAAPAGEAETPTQSGSGFRAGGGPRGGLSGDQTSVPG